MLRIARVAYSTLKPGVQIKVYNKCQSLNVPKFTTISRFYSSEDDDCDKDSRRYRGKCRPDTGKSCRPPPPPVKKYIPPLNVCQTPNLMSQCPQPDCPWEEKAKKNKRTGLIILALGLLATAISLIIFKMSVKPEELPPKKAEDKRRRRPPIKTPSTSADIPKDVPYLLIGGGTASFSAFRAIKSADPQAKVLVVGAEEHFPYMRPPLSKEMWFNEDAEQVKKLIFKQWNGSERSLLYEPKEFYTRCKDLKNSQNGGVAVARGWSIKRIDVINRIAYLEDDAEIHYGKCLIATGALPKNLDIFASASADPKVDERVSLFRDIMDFEEMYDVMESSQHIAIVGGGFLGSELACALARRGKKKRQVVTQIFREAGNMGKILPEYLSYWTTEKVKGEGVIVINNSEVVGVKSVDNKVCLTLNNGKQLLVDHVIVAVGVEANTELAEKSDLEVDPDLGGYLVNTELQARSHLYIAGDCACFYDTKLGRRRVEHHDHAVISGRLAGENMTGAEKPYLHQSMFWSDLGPEVGYEAIGIVDSSLPTVGVFAKATDKDNPQAVVTATDEGIRSKTEEVPPECKKYADKDKLKEEKAARMPSSMPQDNEDFGKGVIFYLRDDIVVGIVLWNVFNRMSIARQVLKDERKYEDLNEVAKLFNIHEE